MIRTLTGSITHAEPQSVVIAVQGVGYLVGTPNMDSDLRVNDTCTLHTYLAVRETALTLFGFTSQLELQMFELLLNIPKIGPKSALQILCQATPNLLLEAAQKSDPVYLQKISGIGKKTCENVVQYLHGKVSDFDAHPEVIPQDTLTQTQTDAIDALVSLGYDMNTARETIKNLSGPDSTVNSLVTQALKQIN